MFSASWKVIRFGGLPIKWFRTIYLTGLLADFSDHSLHLLLRVGRKLRTVGHVPPLQGLFRVTLVQIIISEVFSISGQPIQGYSAFRISSFQLILPATLTS